MERTVGRAHWKRPDEKRMRIDRDTQVVFLALSSLWLYTAFVHEKWGVQCLTDIGKIWKNVKNGEHFGTCPLKKTRQKTDENWRRYTKSTWSGVKSCGCMHGLCVGNEVQSKVTVPHRHLKNMEKCSKLEPITYFVVYKISGHLVKYSLRCTINIPHPIFQLSLRIHRSFSSIDF
jgi:hypothetical protein